MQYTEPEVGMLVTNERGFVGTLVSCNDDVWLAKSYKPTSFALDYSSMEFSIVERTFTTQEKRYDLDYPKPFFTWEWVGFDLDGTLAMPIPFSMDKIGPINEHIKKLLIRTIASGYIVKIFTARAYEAEKQSAFVLQYLADNGLPPLPVTNLKDPGMVAFVDDRAVHVSSLSLQAINPEAVIKNLIPEK